MIGPTEARELKQNVAISKIIHVFFVVVRGLPPPSTVACRRASCRHAPLCDPLPFASHRQLPSLAIRSSLPVSSATAAETVSAFIIALHNPLLCHLLFRRFFSSASHRFSIPPKHALRVRLAASVPVQLCSRALQPASHALEGRQLPCNGVVAAS
jgi:hypothetical protein